jgi:Tol biopolymer transport system component
LSPRFIRITVFLIVIFGLFATAYILVPKVGTIHRKIDTAGKILYLSDDGNPGKYHIWIVGSDGHGAKDLTPGAQTCSDPNFSPDGSQITFVSDKSGSVQVYIAEADGSSAHAVTFGSSSKNSPSFSPDGKTLTYLTQGTLMALDIQSNDGELLLPPAATETTATTAPPDDLTHSPVVRYYWSPLVSSDSNSGQSIAAVQESADTGDELLTILPTMQSTPKPVATATNITGEWSPDGSQFYAAVLGAKVGPTQQNFSGIVSVSPLGIPAQKPPLAATHSLTVGPTNPSVSPDGLQVLFSVVREPDLAHRRIIGIYNQPTDGSADPKLIAAGPAINVQWSPDGKEILLLAPTQHASGHDLWTVEMNGSSTGTNLTGGDGDVTSAEWSPVLPHSN